MVFLETGCEDTACEPTTEDEVVGHGICQGELLGLEQVELFSERWIWIKKKKDVYRIEGK